jgi:hypothetical protein
MAVNKGVEALSHSEILDIADTLNSAEGPATRRAFSLSPFESNMAPGSPLFSNMEPVLLGRGRGTLSVDLNLLEAEPPQQRGDRGAGVLRGRLQNAARQR